MSIVRLILCDIEVDFWALADAIEDLEAECQIIHLTTGLVLQFKPVSGSFTKEQVDKLQDDLSRNGIGTETI